MEAADYAEDHRYAERLADCDLRRWFFGALTAADTPLTLLHEWIVGESVDLINCAATECAHKPFVPVTEGHASEWVMSIVSLLSDLEMTARPGRTADDFERVASEHSRRLPEPSDVEKARAGIPVVERANYGCGGPVDKTKKMFGTRLRCASDFAPRAICQGSSVFFAKHRIFPPNKKYKSARDGGARLRERDVGRDLDPPAPARLCVRSRGGARPRIRKRAANRRRNHIAPDAGLANDAGGALRFGRQKVLWRTRPCVDRRNNTRR